MAGVKERGGNFMRYPGAAGDSASLQQLAHLLAPVAGSGRAHAGDLIASTTEALRANPPGDDRDLAILTLYLQLWAMDIQASERYSAERLRFDVCNPPADFWYQRVDTAGSHQFFQDDAYFTNTIPAACTDRYFNSEIYNGTQTRQQPRHVVANLFPVDDPRDLANFAYDLFLNIPFVPGNGLDMSARVRVENLKGGSRGWGLWSTSVLPPTMQVAWFIQFNGVETGGVKPFYDNGFYAITQNGVCGMAVTKLADLDDHWHDYRLWIGDGAVHFFIDGNCVASVTNPDAIPSAPMAFHNWVDNALFGWDEKKEAIVHILQQTDAPRSNRMQNLRIRSLP